MKTIPEPKFSMRRAFRSDLKLSCVASVTGTEETVNDEFLFY